MTDPASNRSPSPAAHATTRPARPPCSVILATQHLDADAEVRITEVCEAASVVGGEVVVASGCGPRPASLADSAHVRWIDQPSDGLFDLRRRAVAAATGEIVVITEDHCRVSREWLVRIQESHARHPDADVVMGMVGNGTADRAVDRAAYYMNFSALLPPVDGRVLARQIPIVGASIKRPALEALLAACPDVPPELVPADTLGQLGVRIRFDAAVRVDHLQTTGGIGHGVINFHNARAIAGTPRHRRRLRTWLRAVGLPALVILRTARILRRLRQSDVPASERLALLPVLVWLNVSKAAGELVGLFFGPGESALELH